MGLKKLAFLVVLFCSIALNAKAQSIGFSLKQHDGANGRTFVFVHDDFTRVPVVEARITVAAYNEINSPSYVVLTDEFGVGEIPRLKDVLKAITVEKEGFQKVSVVGVEQGELSISLKRQPDNRTVVASGNVTGWPKRPNKSWVQVGLVFRSLSAFDLLSFDADSLISPLTDTVDVLGPRQVPSNLVIPPQDVYVFFSSFWIEKPLYRLPLQHSEPVRLAAVQGQVMVEDLMGLSNNNGQVSLEFLNKLKTTRVGLTDALFPTQDFRKDFNADYQVSPYHKVLLTNPPFTSDLIVAAVTDVNGDRETLLPTDIKAGMTLENQNLRTPVLSAPVTSFGKKDVVAIAVAPEGKRITGIIVDQAGKTVQPGPFALVEERPSLNTVSTIDVRAPASGFSTLVFETDYPVWTVFVLPAVGQVSVPTAAVDATVSRYSVSDFHFGAAFNEKSIDGTILLKSLEKFTRASARAVDQ